MDAQHTGTLASESAYGTMRDMADDGAEVEVHEGLEGVVAFRTEIAEPDKEGSALRYRGVDIEEIVGRVPFENVWGLLIDGTYQPGLPPAEPYNIPIHTGDVRADVQAGVAMLAPMLGMRQTYDICDEQARARPLAGRGHGAVVRRAGGPRPRAARSCRSARSTRAARSPSGS